MLLQQRLFSIFKVNSVSEFLYTVLLPALLCFYIGYSTVQHQTVYSAETSRETASLSNDQFLKSNLEKNTMIFNASLDDTIEISRLRKLLKITNNDPDLYNNIATHYSQIKKYKKAEASYKAAISLKSDHLEAHFNLAVLYERKKQWVQSAEMYKKYLALSPKSPLERAVKNRVRTLNSLAASRSQRRTW